MPKVIEWRHDIHQYPELSNREFRTSKKVADHLISIGLEVETEVAHTGVVGLLKGGLPGPVIAIRADMDALPVIEKTGLSYASQVKTTYLGNEVGVMHACGHDAHVAILMGVAEFFAKHKEQIKGSIVFIFQPAEEGPPEGENGGAKMMLEEGLFKKYQPEVIFGYMFQMVRMAISDLLQVQLWQQRLHGELQLMESNLMAQGPGKVLIQL